MKPRWSCCALCGLRGPREASSSSAAMARGHEPACVVRGCRHARLRGWLPLAEVQGKRGLLKRYKPTVRVHDLRHTFASHLVSNGAPLQVVGAMLGHRNAATTMRYSHIADTAKRERANQWGQLLEFASAKKLA